MISLNLIKHSDVEKKHAKGGAGEFCKKSAECRLEKGKTLKIRPIFISNGNCKTIIVTHKQNLSAYYEKKREN